MDFVSQKHGVFSNLCPIDEIRCSCRVHYRKHHAPLRNLRCSGVVAKELSPVSIRIVATDLKNGQLRFFCFEMLVPLFG